MLSSGLFNSLRNGMSALRAQSVAIEAVGRNMANVNNPAYSRQRVVLGDAFSANGATGGLAALQIDQLRDTLIDRQVVREKSSSASLSAEVSGYERGEAALGESIASVKDTTLATSGGNSLANAMAGFFGAARGLATDPNNATQKQLMIQSANVLTDRFNFSDARLGEVQSDLTSQAQLDTAKANQLLESVTELNVSILRLEGSSQVKALDLRDQRQARIEELAGLMDFRVEANANQGNQVDLVVTSATGQSLKLVAGSKNAGPLSLSGAVVSMPASDPAAAAVALTLRGGSIQGNLKARDGALQNLRDDINLLAKQFITSVNTAYNPGGTGQNFFDAAGTGSGSIRVANGLTSQTLRAGAVSGPAGDGSVAAAISEIDIRAFNATTNPGTDVISGTLGQSYAGSIARFSQILSQARMSESNQVGVLAIVTGQRDSVSGVSLDEEAAELMKFQRAYQASARVIGVIDNLLEVESQLVGR